MSISTEGLARVCAGHPKRTLAAWLGAVLVSFVLIALLLGDALTAPLVDLVRSQDGQDGFRVSITGSLTADADFEKLSEEDLQKGELLIGLPAALIILVLVFGAVLAGDSP